MFDTDSRYQAYAPLTEKFSIKLDGDGKFEAVTVCYNPEFDTLVQPKPSPVVTNGSHANACSSGNVNEPIDQIFGTDFPA